MKLEIDTPQGCAHCVFGEEGGCWCSLLEGENIDFALIDNWNERMPWCPFDNDGKTITAEGVRAIK